MKEGQGNVDSIGGPHTHDHSSEPEHGRYSAFINDDCRFGKSSCSARCVNVSHGVFKRDAWGSGWIFGAHTRKLVGDIGDVFWRDFSRVTHHAQRRLFKIDRCAGLAEKAIALLANNYDLAAVEIEAMHQRLAPLVRVDKRSDSPDL